MLNTHKYMDGKPITVEGDWQMAKEFFKHWAMVRPFLTAYIHQQKNLWGPSLYISE